MEKVFRELNSALALGSRGHIAIVGGGGKTTAMFALAGEFCKRGNPVVTTTTTKIWLWEARQTPRVFFASGYPVGNDLKREVKRYGHVFVCQKVNSSGKVAGISPGLADSIYLAPWLDYLVVEADGASGRPVKVPAEHEPVIPVSATEVVAVMGLESLGAPFCEANVFRGDRFERITGLRPGEIMTPSSVAKIFADPEGIFKGSPRSARRVVFLNKMDLLRDVMDSQLLSQRILKLSEIRIDRVVIGSLNQGNFIAMENGR